MIRTGCQAKLAAWFNMDTEMQACARLGTRAAIDRQIATRPDSSSLFGSLAVWHRAGVPVFQASGSQRGTSKAWTRLGRLKLRAEGMMKAPNVEEGRKDAASQQRDAELQTAVKYEPQQVAACTAQPGSAMKHAAHSSRAQLMPFSTAKSHGMQSADAVEPGGLGCAVGDQRLMSTCS